MGYLRFEAVVLILVLCSTNAFPSDDSDSDCYYDCNSNSDSYYDCYDEIQEVDPEVGRQMAQPTSHLRVGSNDTSAGAHKKLNEIIDIILKVCREPIQENGLDRVEIPNFRKKFIKKVGVVNVRGSFKARDGWFEKLTSIKRRGHAKGRLDDTAVRFDSTLGFDELRFGMAYTAKLSGLKVKGKLTAEVDGNALSFTGGMDFSSDRCKLFVENIKLEELTIVRVDVTGLGILNGLNSKIVTWVISSLRENVRNTVENKMRKIVGKALDKVKCPRGVGRFFRKLLCLKKESRRGYPSSVLVNED